MKDQIIIACDFKSRADLEAFLEPFSQESLFLKIGMEMFYKEGRSLVEDLKARGHRIFLDLKLHDIPNTAQAAAHAIKDLDVDFLTVHAQGGQAMMEAVVKALQGTNTKVLAVSVLTSIDQQILHDDLGIDQKLVDYTVRLARLAESAGVYGCICSPLEVPAIKAGVGSDFACVTPGVRFATDTLNDQKRVMTPELALANGANYLVIGRSITQAANPYETYLSVAGDQ